MQFQIMAAGHSVEFSSKVLSSNMTHRKKMFLHTVPVAAARRTNAVLEQLYNWAWTPGQRHGC